MLGFLFGFNARIGRLYFFLITIGLALVMTAIAFAVAGYMFEHTPKGIHLSADDLMTWPVIVTGVIFFFATFSLQAIRIRDIGWDPVCVIPAWIAIAIVDRLVAIKIPSWSIGHSHQGTIVGLLINVVLGFVLLFWPSGDLEGWTPSPLGESHRKPNEPAPRQSGASAPAGRIAQATRAGFGQRGW
ncbi:DUF805 domain-containing protein [Bradyrhizobium canariense]|uniref:DUF805 domain-containing protein n=1 Tax=Bradyrhizobium canariense TaxID=255045 RepID=A0A1H1RC59_9BRAD|nr:DUF805 domain-containing protein [Bradyrhizobium canariense]SDS33255.1 hypothetical protein SAMN05444158_1730 [Bradyrhizobium canariense]